MPALTSILMGVGAGVSAISGIANAAANMSAADRAKAAQDKGLQEWLKINIPNPEDQKIALARFVSAGTLDPHLENAIKQDPSGLKQVTTSMTQKSAQNRALQQLQEVGNNGGLRLQDKTALQDAQMQSNVKARSDRDAISSDMARRGQGGSGFEVAAQLEGQQGQADRDASNSLKVAGSAQDRALQAIMGAGDMATKQRSQEFGEEAQKAQAQDAINKFNTANLQDVQQRNIGSQNAAAATNLANAQDISNRNVGVQNTEEQHNKALLQQQFDNQAKLAAGKSGQYAGQAATEVNQGEKLGNAFSNIGGGVGSALNAGAQNKYWDDYFAKQKAAKGV